LTGQKLRPAVVISSTLPGDDVIVVFITSQDKLRGKHLVPVEPNTDNGLKTQSQIVCDKIATLDEQIIVGALGAVSADTQDAIDAELKTVLSL
jgi:mRNA-degrading endonuclease toxin of MazEF toxin-antitoxin module